MNENPALTQALAAAEADPNQRDRFLSLVYDDLLRMAHRELARHRTGETLNTAALVHEAYLKLFGRESHAFENRQHFFATAARAMRQIVIDYARSRLAQIRGAGAQHIALDDLDGNALPIDAQAENLVHLDAALSKLGSMDERLERVVELRFFCGMEIKEIAEVIGMSEPTVKRDLRAAKAFLGAELGAPTDQDG